MAKAATKVFQATLSRIRGIATTVSDTSPLTGILMVCLLIFLVVLIRTAWVCDDSYITFRTVDNLVKGYGLTWNPDERVQSYTNPLWMLLIATFYLLTHDVYFTSIFISIAISMATVAILVFRIGVSPILSGIGLVVLLFSKAFVDYSTSGLENPLSCFLFAIFFLIFIRPSHNHRKLLGMSLMAGLAALNRQDTILFYLPAIAYAFWKTFDKRRSIWIILGGCSPFILWEVFCLLYYGFPFPNTGYAKMGTGISMGAYLAQGLLYFLDSIVYDPITLSAIVIGLFMPLINRTWEHLPIACGVLLYLIFVTTIGGCFMSGRYFTVPLLAAVMLILRDARNPRHRIWWGVAVFIIAVGLAQPSSTVLSGADYSGDGIRPSGIADERGIYYPQTGLLNAKRGCSMLNHPWAVEGHLASLKGPDVVTRIVIGFYGFYAGPHLHIIDELALADALLARLPHTFPNWRIGHFPRNLPDGYLESVRDNQTKISNQDLAAYYDKLTLITRGSIFASDRLLEILRMNLGLNQYLLDRYTKAQMDTIIVGIDKISTPKVEGTRWNLYGNRVFSSRGIRINLGQQCKAKRIEISLDGNDVYQLIYFNGNAELARQNIPQHRVPGGGLAVHTVNVPTKAIAESFDAIMVLPSEGDQMYSIGHIRLLDP